MPLKKCAVFLCAMLPRNKQVVSQPACLYFMVQFQYVKSHTYKIPFHHNIGAASGQEAAEVHVFLCDSVEQSHWFIWRDNDF